MMSNSQPGQGVGVSGSQSPFSGPDGSTAASTAQPTVLDFLSRIVGDPEARSAFEANPQAALNNAGLGELSATQVQQAASLVLDYAPVEVVHEYGRTVQSSIDMFATSTQHVAINHLDSTQEPATPDADSRNQERAEDTSQQAKEANMLSNDKPNYSSEGDVDKDMDNSQQQSQGSENNVENNVDFSYEENHQDSHNVVSVHDVVSDNTVGVAGDTVNSTVNSVTNTVDNTVNTVDTTVNSTVDTGLDVVGSAPNSVLNVTNELGVDDVTANVGNIAGGVTNTVAGGDNLPLDLL